MTTEINVKLEVMENSIVLLEQQIFDLKSEYNGQRELDKEKQKRVLLVLIFLVFIFICFSIKCIFSSLNKPKTSHYN